MNSRLMLLLRISFCALVSSAPLGALAWSQTTTESGIPISWDGSCFYYSINNLGSDDFSFDELKQITRASFDVWENVECSHFSFVETEAASVNEIAFYLNRPNANLLVWRENSEDWIYGSTVAALTSVTYDENTGEILDADIEFNGANCEFADLDEYPPASELIDIRGTMAHEIGHTMGLDHSEYPDATMCEWGEAGSAEMRDLTDDDIAGLCAIYPAEQDPGECQEPYCGLGLKPGDVECDEPVSDGTGCSALALAIRKNLGLTAAVLRLFTS